MNINTRKISDDPGTHLRRQRASNLLVAEDSELWWDPRHPQQDVLWKSWVELSQAFFDLITDRPVPVDMDVLRLIKKSPLAIDLYSWASHRVSYMSRPTTVPWQGLMAQLGAGYPDTPQGVRNFRKKLIEALKKIHAAWPEMRAEITDQGLRLRPCPPQVPPRLSPPPAPLP